MSAFLLAGMLFGSQVMAQGRIDLGRTAATQKCVENTEKGFTATFSFSSIESQTVNTEKGVFSNITMDNTYPSGMVGEPTLPVANKLIAVPFGVKDVKVEVKSYSTTIYDLADYDINTLYPQQPLLRKDQKPGDLPFEYNEEAYATRGFNELPIALCEIQGTMRGIQIGTLTVHPVQYDAVNNSIRVYNDIEVEVSFGEYDQMASYDEFARTFSPYFANIYRQTFNWRDDIYDQHPDLWQAPVKMLVVADRMFEECMQEWIAWKTMKGFYMDVNYTDEIGTSANQIKTFVQSKYEETAPTFIIIFGDKNQVAASATGNQTGCVTDLYYMSTDGDEFPEMFHSRMCAETVAQMNNILEKSLEYEMYTMPDPSYLSNVLLIAGADSGWGVTVGRPTIWYATNYYYNTDHGFENVYEYTTSNYNGCYSHMNTGVGFANYTAHGSNTSWADPNMTVNDVNNLTNEHKYFLAMGNCCEAADWGISGTCFGEAMIRAEKKAAYAYIGSCPSTYWLNDYYFGVGATGHANGTMPTMEETTMGCYDAIWDDNAYNTVSAIPFIGNLASNAAQALGHELHIGTLYCWQAYHALGDGSIMPYRVNPTPNDVTHLPTLPIGMDYYEISATPGSYAAISKDGVLYGAGLIDETGTTNIEIEPITSGGDVTICVTHPQHQPYIATIPAASLDGAYITFDSYEINTTVSYGAWVPMHINLKNVGADAASNLSVTLTTESEYVSFINNEGHVDNIAPNQVVSLNEMFDFDLAVNVPDKTKIQFFVNVTDGTNTWESKFNITASAPVLAMGAISNTELAAGGNGTMSFDVINNGTGDAHDIVFEVYSSSDDIQIASNTFALESLAAGETATFTCDVTVANGVEVGSTYEIGYFAAAGHYSVEGTYVLTVGNIIEGFETGDFSMYDWQMGGDANWSIATDEVNSGTYSAKSGVINHYGETSLNLTIEILASGELSFYRKVSSENNYDKLYFYIDGTEMGNWSGEVAWSQVTFNVSAGVHTFKWAYKKDVSVSSGSDCAWVDDIQFPPTNVIVALNDIQGLEARVDNNTVTLAWNNVAGATNYVIRRDGEIVATQASNNFEEVVADGVYVYSVVAEDNNGSHSLPAFVTVNVGTVGVADNNVNINVYPNPANSMLNIVVNADYEYVMYNNMGQQVMTGSANGQQQLNVSGLAQGIYMLRITTCGQTEIQKIVVR